MEKNTIGKDAASTTLSLRERIQVELAEQAKTALPTLATMLLYKIPWLISLRFVGGIGAQELAAAALASTLCNVTGMSIAVGLSSALTTLAGQARGDLQFRSDMRERKTTVNFGSSSNCDDERAGLLESEINGYQATPAAKEQADSGRPLLPVVYLYRGLFIQFLFVVPIGIWWIYGIEPTLLALGQGTLVSKMTAEYLRLLTPGLWSYSVCWTLTAWLQTLEMADVPAFAAAIGLAIHVPANFFFIHTLGFGYLGVAVATVTTQLIQPILISIYVFGTKAGRDRVLKSCVASALGRTRLSFWPEAKAAVDMKGVFTYLALAIPGIVLISEWWAAETATFLSGRLVPSPDLALGGMTLYQSLNAFCFMFPVAVSVAGSTRVGYLLGGGKPKQAKFAGLLSTSCTGVVGSVLGCILYFTPHGTFPSLFAPDQEDLIAETSRTISLLSFYVFADGLQSGFSGIVKGCGRQAITMPIVIFSYWVVAIPLGYYLAFVRNNGYMCEDNYFCGDVGLVTGMTVGTYLHMLLLGVAVLTATDWKAESSRARERLDSHQLQEGETIHAIGEETCRLSM